MYSPGIYLFIISNGNTRTMCEICSDLTKKDTNNVVLVSLLLTLNTFHILFWCFHYYRLARRIHRIYSKPLLGATITPNLVPWVSRKIFSLEILSDICLGRASKQNNLFSENVPPKNAPMPIMFRIGHASALRIKKFPIQTTQSI